MGTYRISRNLEASIIDFLTTKFDADWSGVSIVKTFNRAYDVDLPVVCVRVGDTTHDKAEIGGDSTIRTPLLLLDIFAKSDGQRLDMKDYIIEKIKGGLIYYDYIIVGGVVDSKTPDGRIRVLNIDDVPVDFDMEKSSLELHDRYRHLISLTVSRGKVEA